MTRSIFLTLTLLATFSMTMGCGGDTAPTNVTEGIDASAIAEYEANEARLRAETEASLNEK